jgi:hypothetical protein
LFFSQVQIIFGLYLCLAFHVVENIYGPHVFLMLKECFWFFVICFVVFSCMVKSLEMCNIFVITTAEEAWFTWFLLASKPFTMEALL